MSHLALLKAPIVKEGYLKKNPSAKGKDEVRPGFKERYFVLRGRSLNYYEKPGKLSKPKGEIDLRAARIDPADEKTGKPYTVRIAQAKQVFTYLQLSNAEQQNSWVLELRKAAGYSAAESEEATIKLLYQDFKSSMCSFSALLRPAADAPPEKVVVLLDSFHGGHLKIIKKQQVLFSYNSADIVRAHIVDRKSADLSLINAMNEIVKLQVLDVELKVAEGLSQLRIYLVSKIMANYLQLVIMAVKAGNLAPVRGATIQSSRMKDYVRVGDEKARTSTDFVQRYVVLSDGHLMFCSQSNSIIPYFVTNLCEASFEPDEDQSEKLFILDGLEKLAVVFDSTNSRDSFMMQVGEAKQQNINTLTQTIRALEPAKKKEKVTPKLDDSIPPPPASENNGRRTDEELVPLDLDEKEVTLNFNIPYTTPLTPDDNETETFLLMFGIGDNGQLANKEKMSSLVPVPVPALAKKRIRSISAGNTHCCAVTPQGHIFTWGEGEMGQLGLGTRRAAPNPFLMTSLMREGKIALVSCGARHTLAVNLAGKVFAWGDNRQGQCGVSATKEALDKPVTVAGMEDFPCHFISAGSEHSAAITGFKVFSWGSNKNGALGCDKSGEELRCSPLPQAAVVDQSTHMAAISCGKDFTAAIDSKGRLFTWGSNSHGKLGIGSTSRFEVVPKLVPHFGQLGYVVNRISVGDEHCVALCSDTKSTHVFSWGQKIVNGTMDDQFSPALIPALSKIRFVSASNTHSICISDKGRVFAFGVNNAGELGNGQAGVQALVKAKINKQIQVIGCALGRSFSMLIARGAPVAQLLDKEPSTAAPVTKVDSDAEEKEANEAIDQLLNKFNITPEKVPGPPPAQPVPAVSKAQVQQLLHETEVAIPPMPQVQAPEPTPSMKKKKKKKELPPGWTAHWSEEHERNFYNNSATGETVWKRPKV